MDIRTRAATVLGIVEGQVPIYSDDKKKRALFSTYTDGQDHDNTLLPYWRNARPPHILTTCNAFVNWYSTALGFRLKLGAFETEQYLKDNGMHHAWVPSATGLEPKRGDILRHASYHMDVAWGFDSGKLVRMASGQSGPKYKHDPLGKGGLSLDEPNSRDLIDKVTGKTAYDPAQLLGWVDIELAWPSEQPVPQGLHGWWRHVFDDSGDTYHYWFGNDRVVHWQVSPPMNPKLKVFAPMEGNVGVFINEEPNQVNIKWKSGTHEEYTWDGGDSMNGPYNGGPDTITATKL